MTEQTAPETEVTVTPTDVNVVVPEKRFRFTRKQIGYTLAATAAGAGLIWLKVKNSASKDDDSTEADTTPESESSDSV